MKYSVCLLALFTITILSCKKEKKDKVDDPVSTEFVYYKLWTTDGLKKISIDGQQTQIVNVPTPENYMFALGNTDNYDISKDGTTILYSLHTSFNTDLFTCGIDGGNFKALDKSGQDNIFTHFLNDTSYIYWSEWAYEYTLKKGSINDKYQGKKLPIILPPGRKFKNSSCLNFNRNELLFIAIDTSNNNNQEEIYGCDEFGNNVRPILTNFDIDTFEYYMETYTIENKIVFLKMSSRVESQSLYTINNDGSGLQKLELNVPEDKYISNRKIVASKKRNAIYYVLASRETNNTENELYIYDLDLKTSTLLKKEDNYILLEFVN